MCIVNTTGLGQQVRTLLCHPASRPHLAGNAQGEGHLLGAGARGAGSSTMDPEELRVWGHQPKGRSGWERKEPGNKPTRAEEGNRWRRGRSSSEQLPGVSILTLWTRACHCHCGTKHRTAAQMHAHRQPEAAGPPARHPATARASSQATWLLGG